MRFNLFSLSFYAAGSLGQLFVPEAVQELAEYALRTYDE